MAKIPDPSKTLPHPGSIFQLFGLGSARDTSILGYLSGQVHNQKNFFEVDKNIRGPLCKNFSPKILSLESYHQEGKLSTKKFSFKKFWRHVF